VDDCGACVVQLASGALFCDRCGCQLLARRSDLAQNFACPSCQQFGRVQRVSGVVRHASSGMARGRVTRLEVK